ncbi:cyclin [Thozetella sp. PMI_491]|nr:cyclin [Thozetella sp. PMI_491]
MDSIPSLGMAELNAAALEHFVYKQVDPQMIAYLANAAYNVIQCDPNMMPPSATEARSARLPPSPPKTPPPRPVRSEDGGLPTLEEFITQLVVSSNVQVPTLMSTLVYLNRLKSKLQPMAKGLRCTTHRIFLASLILSAKYLNDSSPKNKHWANYSVITNEYSNFGFSRTEVNLMEKQLLFLLDWDLRITEEDLYRELDFFLAPIRNDIQVRHERRARKNAERMLRKQQEEAWIAVAAASYPSPPSSRGHSRSRSRHATPGAASDASPPGLSSASSYSGSTSSRSTTPLSDAETDPNPYVYSGAEDLYDPPVEIVLERPCMPEKDYAHRKTINGAGKQLLPYEISAEELREMQQPKRMRGVFGRVFASSQSLSVR